MLDLTTIILTYNEEKHIRRCLDNVCKFSKHIIIVDSPSTDRTIEICKEYANVDIYTHLYPGNQADQLNWALDNIKIETQWILRLDADEYLSNDLIQEFENKIPRLQENISGVFLQRNHIFMGKHMKYERNATILRLFRNGKAQCENRLMDEYMLIKEGNTTIFDHLFFDHNLCTLDEYCQKHINYAVREAAMILIEKYETLKYTQITSLKSGIESTSFRKSKNKYNNLPVFWRCFAYFIYRYIFTGTFIQGKAGFVYCFVQGWWYRVLVDGILNEAENYAKGDKNKIIEYMNSKYHIDL